MNSPHDQFAQDYDQQIEKYDCWLAEVVFGLCYGDMQAGESLLDIGIGTGLSSRLFHQAGLRISGIDGSEEMLAICRSKGIAQELTRQDILDLPWPYRDAAFKHVICCGVFHFIDDLETVFAEMHRVQAENGLLAFTVMKGDEKQPRQQQRVTDGIPVFSHSANYVHSLLNEHHYEKRKEIVSFVGETPFRVICARKSPT
jgi:predicted TPR repeat methyltransferase